MLIAMISDTHENWHNLKVPECDILISAGDYSFRGQPHVIREYHAWLDKQPAQHIISVQGNHEVWVEQHKQEARDMAAEVAPTVLFVDTGIIRIQNTPIWVSSVTPTFFNWAYMKNRGQEIRDHWNTIPKETQILITHGPAYGILDTISPMSKEHLGCEELAKVIPTLPNLKLHVFGHIHGGSGEETHSGVRYVNASICNERYIPVNPVRTFELKESGKDFMEKQFADPKIKAVYERLAKR